MEFIMAQEKKAPDWERIEVDYRAGLLSVREIAAEHGVSHTAIQKRAKAQGWERDLKAKIKAKADSLVAKSEVANQVATEKVATERQLVEANAQVIADIRVKHRKDIAKARSLAMSLLVELEAQTDNTDLLDQLAEALSASEDSPDGLMRAFNRVTSTSGRIDSMKKLAESLKVLIGMEREAYEVGAGDDDQPPKPEAFDYSRLSKEALRELLTVAHESAKTS